MKQMLTKDDVFTLSLESNEFYKDPFRDITVSVVFSAPDGKVTEIPAQYVQNKWVVKFVPFHTGHWKYQTICSETSDSNLHHIVGSFVVLPRHERKRFLVDDYGAYPNQSKNSLPAMEAAIEAAKQYTNKTGQYAEVSLTAGAEYHFATQGGDDGKATISIEDAKNLTLNGNGAQIIFDTLFHSGVVVRDSENVNLLNFSIDYNPLPYTQGQIVGIDNEQNTIDIRIDEGWPGLDHEMFSLARSSYGITRIFEGGTYKYGPTAIEFLDKEEISDSLWRCHLGGGFYSNQIEKVHIGDDFVYKANTYGCAVGILSSYNVRAEGIVFYSSPGLNFYPFASECVMIRDCHVMLKGYDRFVSTNADGVHARSNRGFLMIEGCSFEGMSDDGINIHSSAMSVQKVINSHTVIVTKHTFTVRPGDRLVIMDRVNGRIRAEVYVIKVEDSDYTQTITFDQDVPGISTGSHFSNADNLYNLNSCGSSFVIRNCHFKSHRCRDILLSTQYGIVENNIFENEDGWGIALFHETEAWGEGPIVRDVKIRNNTFYGRSQAGQAGIYAYIAGNGEGFHPSQEIKNISITGNVFYDVGKVMDLHAMSDSLIANNTVETRPDTQRRFSEYHSITLENCDNIWFQNNTVHDLNRNLKSVYQIAHNCGDTIAVDETTVTLARHVVLMIDERSKSPKI